MEANDRKYKSQNELETELAELRHQLEEANDTIEAIRTGQIDALIVQGETGPQLYTLKSADQTYRFFIEKMAGGAVTLNAAGVILYSNSQFARMVRRSLTDVIGYTFADFLTPECRHDFSKFFNSGWQNDHKVEVQLIANAEKTPVQLSLTPLALDDEISLGIIVTDLTTQKASQLQLKKSNAELEKINLALESSNHDLQQFASVASHDLQEPVRKIQVFSNLLKEKQTDLSPESKRYIEKIILSAGRMKALIIDILTYSRLSANQFQMEPVDLNELMKEMLEDFELQIQDKQASIHIAPLETIDANKGQLRQVFQNIVSNAIKFSKTGQSPVIEISSYRLKEKSFKSPRQKKGSYLLICIKDNGIGFNEKYLSNIFALFERLNSKDNYEGTGIGMAIAKKIVDKHNGLITARSKEDKGTEFKIILPVVQENS